MNSYNDNSNDIAHHTRTAAKVRLRLAQVGWRQRAEPENRSVLAVEQPSLALGVIRRRLATRRRLLRGSALRCRRLCLVCGFLVARRREAPACGVLGCLCDDGHGGKVLVVRELTECVRRQVAPRVCEFEKALALRV